MNRPKELECTVINFNFNFNFSFVITLHNNGYNYSSVVSYLNLMHYSSLHNCIDLRNVGRIVDRYVVQFQEVQTGSVNC